MTFVPDMFDIEQRFRAKLRERMIVPPDVLEFDGRLHRCDIEGKKGKKDAAYLLHGDGVISGGCENWADGIGWENWCSRDPHDITSEEYSRYLEACKRSAKLRETEDQLRRAEARDAAAACWEIAEPVGEHPYLRRKAVRAHGVKLHEGRLVVPMQDSSGVIHSLQFIDADGSKRYLTGGRKKGCWFMIGTPGEVICIAEGYATAASIHEATGFPVAVSFDCGNLGDVAKAIRAKHATAKIVLCADDDWKTDGNPGTKKATEAARAVSGVVAIPDFPSNRPDKATDFNDLSQLCGLTTVKECIEKAIITDSGPISARDLFPQVYREIEDRKTGKKKTSLSTGIVAVDRFTGGLRRGYLTVVAGLPGSGKTSAAAGIIVYSATHGIPCLLFSIEMDRIDIGIRLVSMDSGITASDIFDDKTQIDAKGFGKIMDSCERLGDSLLTIDDRAVTTTQLEDQAHKWHSKEVRAKGYDMGLIVVDYLGLIRSEGKGETRNREVAEMTQRCKLLARTLRNPVILLAQLNRQAANRGDQPQLSDLRDSGEVEAAADMAIFPYPAIRDQDGNIIKSNGELETADLWLIHKNRNGAKGAVRVQWNPKTMTYTDHQTERT